MATPPDPSRRAESPVRSRADEPRVPDGRGLLLALVPLSLVLFIATLDQTIVATAIPTIGRDLGDLDSAPWIATAYLLTSAVTTLIFGKLGDMHGRKWILQFSIVVFLAGSFLCGIAPSIGALIAFRALQGVGGGGLSSLVQAITGDLIPARERSRYQAYLGIVATLAIIAGPLLGGFFSDALSWRWIFYVNLPVGIAALALIALRLHLPVRRSGGRVDLAGGALVTVASTAIITATVLGGEGHGWTSGLVLGLFATGIASLVAYLRVESRAAEPITPLGLFRNQVFSISSVLFFLSTLVLFVAMLYVPAFMQAVHHYSAFDSGLFLIPLLVGLIVATAVSGQLIARTGRYRIYPIVGSVLTGAGMFVLSLITAGTPVVLLGALLVVIGAGLGFFVQVSLLAGQNAVPGEVIGIATGALNYFKTLGGAFGAAIFGAILASQLHGSTVADYVPAFQTVFFWAVPFVAVALVLALVMHEKPLSEEMIAVAAGEAEVPEY